MIALQKLIYNNPQTWMQILVSKSIVVKEDEHFYIFNYDIAADFSDEVVRNCRGIILDKEFNIVCYPFDKFCNYHETYHDDIDWSSAKVQDKIDGCVDENTLILTNYGPTTIKNIINSKRHYKVLTYNHELQKTEFQEIDGFSIKDNDGKQWYEIETDYGNLRLTGNHKVFCINENRYKRVDELNGTEELQLIEPSNYQLTNKLNQYQKIYELICDNINIQYLNGISIYELATKYRCDWKLIKKVLLGYYNIYNRTVKESINTNYTKNKMKETILQKYGVENVSQSLIIKKQKEQTFLKHYGVTNIRKLPEFYDYVNIVCLNKFGKKRITNSSKLKQTRQKHLEENQHYYDYANQVCSENAKKLWNNYSEEEKQLKINKLQEGYKKSVNIKNYRSKIEIRVYNIVKNHTDECQHTFWINKPKKYSYDILFNKNKIIEINGDYWHANPIKYKSNDLLHLKGIGSITAQEIWNKDLNKKNQAINAGYNIIYLWESEINKLSDNQIWDLIQERFNII